MYKEGTILGITLFMRASDNIGFTDVASNATV
jgi:hypothetical protein